MLFFAMLTCRMMTAIPCLIERLRGLPDAEDVIIAFPDEGTCMAVCVDKYADQRWPRQ
jgi:hypothetical protein